jgi:hypothetical protein
MQEAPGLPEYLLGRAIAVIQDRLEDREQALASMRVANEQLNQQAEQMYREVQSAEREIDMLDAKIKVHVCATDPKRTVIELPDHVDKAKALEVFDAVTKALDGSAGVQITYGKAIRQADGLE